MQIHPIYMLINRRKRARNTTGSTSPTLTASIIHLEEMMYSLTRKPALATKHRPLRHINP